MLHAMTQHFDIIEENSSLITVKYVHKLNDTDIYILHNMYSRCTVTVMDDVALIEAIVTIQV